MIQTTCASPISRRVIDVSGVPDVGYDSIGIASQETQPVGSDNGDEAPPTVGGPLTQEVYSSTSRAGLPTAYVYENQAVPILAVEGTTYPSRMMIRSPSSTVYYGVESTSTPNISYVSSSCASTCNFSASHTMLSAFLSSVLTVLLYAIYKRLRDYLRRIFKRANNDSDTCGGNTAPPSLAYSDSSGVADPGNHLCSKLS
ncbi:uncharacterized protein EV420DRAFT_1646589 [Desarmillaria tabescens]|uniref:Uncharacterized protein n=1 Tax=Armillaria tabescens TaxID=1929756 RepID=A0AA39JWR6_ARMTA|nr:uncharacterized protein EV420DRAFT_1646589 [Desarmillaria tabescens]KAK0450352.1 hypothetical protein EV420DRAFT_1646589 [Desarmillaria tabescens]